MRAIGFRETIFKELIMLRLGMDVSLWRPADCDGCCLVTLIALQCWLVLEVWAVLSVVGVMKMWVI